jgi:O-methyltransferase
MTPLHRIFYALTMRYPGALNRSWMSFYPYQFTPAQLCFLCSCIDKTKQINGPIVEAGVSRGFTTIFLNRHLDTLGIERTYWALDTFAGFLPKDVDHEISQRAKPSTFTWHAFDRNRQDWYDRALQLSGVTRVRSVQCDAGTYDYPEGMSFCLLDVDLYLSSKSALKRIIPKMAPGGMLIVDDCNQTENIYDGAAQATREICSETGLQCSVVHEKLAVFQF